MEVRIVSGPAKDTVICKLVNRFITAILLHTNEVRMSRQLPEHVGLNRLSIDRRIVDDGWTAVQALLEMKELHLRADVEALRQGQKSGIHSRLKASEAVVDRFLGMVVAGSADNGNLVAELANSVLDE